MLRKLHWFGLLSAVSCSLGCALCCSPDDYNYGTYGGRWQRHDMSTGRVGSAFAEAGYDSVGDAPAAEPSTDFELQPGDDGIQSVSYEEVSEFIE